MPTDETTPDTSSADRFELLEVDSDREVLARRIASCTSLNVLVGLAAEVRAMSDADRDALRPGFVAVRERLLREQAGRPVSPADPDRVPRAERLTETTLTPLTQPMGFVAPQAAPVAAPDAQRARFASRCQACNAQINVGDPIARGRHAFPSGRHGGGAFVHIACYTGRPVREVAPIVAQVLGVATDAEAETARVAAVAQVVPSLRGVSGADRVSPSGIPMAPRGVRTFLRPAASAEPTTIAGVKGLLGRADLIAGSIAKGSGEVFDWEGSGTTTRPKLSDVLSSIGRIDALPAPKKARAQAGRAVGTVGGRGGLVTRAVTQPKAHETQWDTGTDYRWVIARVGQALSAVGETVLIVDLSKAGTLTCRGDENLAAQVRADYARRINEEVYTSSDMTSWLGGVLHDAHFAVRAGHLRYVPAGEAAAAKELVRAVSGLWGTSWLKGIPMTSADALLDGMTEGLQGEVTQLAADLQTAEDEVKAEGKTQVGARRASGLLTKLDDVSERVRGYQVLLGTDRVAGIKAEIDALRAKIEPLTSSEAQRAALLEQD